MLFTCVLPVPTYSHSVHCSSARWTDSLYSFPATLPSLVSCPVCCVVFLTLFVSSCFLPLPYFVFFWPLLSSGLTLFDHLTYLWTSNSDTLISPGILDLGFLPAHLAVMFCCYFSGLHHTFCCSCFLLIDLLVVILCHHSCFSFWTHHFVLPRLQLRVPCFLCWNCDILYFFIVKTMLVCGLVSNCVPSVCLYVYMH